MLKRMNNWGFKNSGYIAIVIVMLVLGALYYDARKNTADDASRLNALIELSQEKDRTSASMRTKLLKEVENLKEQNQELININTDQRNDLQALITQLERMGVKPAVTSSRATRSTSPSSSRPSSPTTTTQQPQPPSPPTSPPTTAQQPPAPESCSFRVLDVCV